MKQRLDQLTLQQLIGLSCGDYTVLVEGDEKPTQEESMKTASRILGEYKSIASPAQFKMDLLDKEKIAKLAIKERCARIALAMCQTGLHDNARDILADLGVGREHLDTEEAILTRCQAILGEVEYEYRRMEEYNAKRAAKQKEPDQVRHAWYAEIASVMSSLKVPVDMGINACVYANLVHQAVERNKAMAKMPPMAGLFM